MFHLSSGGVSPQAIPSQDQPRSKAVLVTVLHPPNGSKRVRTLIAAWAQAVPAAFIEPVLVEHGISHPELQKQIGRELERAGLDRSALVLAGVAGAEKAALQLVCGHWEVDCAGILVCGSNMPPLRVLENLSGSKRTRVRLVWTADDPLFCSLALGGILRRLRASGIDAQETVLASLPRTRDGVDDDETVLSPMVNLSGAYISELVALALCRTVPIPPYPAIMT